MILNIPLGHPFLKSLASFIYEKTSNNPLDMAQGLVILPTQRAVKTLKQIFLDEFPSCLLPKICTPMELEDLQYPIADAMPNYQRLFLLTALAKAYVETPDRAFKIALSLADLLDEVYQYEIDLTKIDLLVEEEFSEHWSETIKFLNIIKDAWPNILNEYQLIDEKERQMRLIHHYADLLIKTPPSSLVVMAGFDNTLPSFAHLAKAVNSLKNGFIFLQGLNTSLSSKDLQGLPIHHLQMLYQRLFKLLNKEPKEAKNLLPPLAKEQFLTHALLQENIKEPFPLDFITRIKTDNTEEEAYTCALLLRQVLETPNKKAVLITNDRNLSRRIIMYMKKFNVELDDSAGFPLSKTKLGSYLSLIAQYAIDPLNHKLFLSLLKHPLTADKKNKKLFEAEVKQAEYLARKNEIKLHFTLTTDLTPLIKLYQHDKISLKELFEAHIKTAIELASSDTQSGEEILFKTEEGEIAFQHFSSVLPYLDYFSEIDPSFYPEILKIILQQITVRKKYSLHPRLEILGPIEARFTQADTYILAGLVEGVWPTRPDTGVWLNKTMRLHVGLPLPEEKNTLEMKDFLTFLCQKEVYLTYAEKVNGSPTISSRFFALIEKALAEHHLSWDLYKPSLTRKLMEVQNTSPCKRPLPILPSHLKPRHLSVTQIAYLLTNPYRIYIEKVLKLKELPPLETLSKNQLYGTVVHKVLEDYLNLNLPPNLIRLARMGFHALKNKGFSDIDCQFYFPRFAKMAHWFVEQELLKQHETKKTYTEISGLWKINFENDFFEISVKADRIDILDQEIEIIDYKTGSIPSENEIQNGLYPQLPLEALMLQESAFQVKFPKNKPIALSYWHVKGTDNNLSIKKLFIPSAKKKNINLQDILQSTKEHLFNTLQTYLTQDIPYGSYSYTQNKQFNPYEHLERTQEWIYTLQEKENI